VIERASRNIPIYSPQQWAAVMRSARTQPKPYQVNELNHNDFIDFMVLGNKYMYFSLGHKDTMGENIAWSKIRALKFKKGEPMTIFLKYDYAEEYRSTKLKKATKGKKVEKLAKMYQTTLNISSAKYADLMQLCNANLIPTGHQEFYLSLKSDDKVDYITDDETD